MNDAQLFVIFFSILVFGWIGFATGRSWDDYATKDMGLRCCVLFFANSIWLFIASVINLISLIGRNF